MAFSTINKSSLYQNNVLYTGNDSTQSITGVGFQPDLWWNKSRSGTHSAGVHCLYDAVRGVTKRLQSNATTAEATVSGVTAFGADGVTLGSENQSNGGSTNYVGWNWKANGAGSANTDGSINSTVSANTTAGFSIVKYTGTNSNATIGHGLGVAPKMIMIKNTSSSSPAFTWRVYHAGLTLGHSLKLDSAAQAEAGYWNNTAPTSTVFSVGANGETNQSGGTNIAYCFAEVTGYSKFGKFLGNGNVNGTFCYTGMRPSFLLIKTTGAEDSWRLWDNARNTYNPMDITLRPNTTDGDYVASANNIDFLSNGFKMRTISGGYNSSSDTLIYMAFGQPIISNSGTVATAR